MVSLRSALVLFVKKTDWKELIETNRYKQYLNKERSPAGQAKVIGVTHAMIKKQNVRRLHSSPTFQLDPVFGLKITQKKNAKRQKLFS